MLKTLRLKTLASAAATCLALAAAGPANAYVYAVSHLDIQDLVIPFGGLTGATINSYTFTVQNTASLNGVPATGSLNNNCNGTDTTTTCGTSLLFPTLDSDPANAPGSSLTRTNNVFTFLGKASPNNYSGSDSVVKTAQLAQGVPTSVELIAEALLHADGSAVANAEIQSTTNLTVSFTVSGGVGSTLNLSFKANPDQQVEIIDSEATAFSAQSNTKTKFTLTRQSDGLQIDWAPRGNGIVLNNCNAEFGTCVETADAIGLNLNRDMSIGSNPNTQSNDFASSVLGNFGIEVTGLTDGEYSLALDALTSVNIFKTPEPGSVALIGLALAGLGVTTARRQKKLV